jgi:hypothetical protein
MVVRGIFHGAPPTSVDAAPSLARTNARFVVDAVGRIG